MAWLLVWLGVRKLCRQCKGAKHPTAERCWYCGGIG